MLDQNDDDDKSLNCPTTIKNWDTFIIESLKVLTMYDVKISSIMPLTGSKLIFQCSSAHDLSSVTDHMLFKYYKSFYACMAG